MPVVQGDRIQLQQVLLNLVLNACDAMSEADPSRRQLTLATELTDGFVQLAVSDGGPGSPRISSSACSSRSSRSGSRAWASGSPSAARS